jgi:hypothetical protein
MLNSIGLANPGIDRFLEDVLPRLDAYRRFIKDSGYETIHTEIEVVHPAWRYCGHPDSIGFLNRARVILDWKNMDALDVQPAGAWIKTRRPLIQVLMSDAVSGLDMTTATLAIDGVAVTGLVVGTAHVGFTPAADLADGAHTLDATVRDRAGSLGTLNGIVGIDLRPPEPATVTGLTDGQVVQGTVAVSAAATDATSGVAQIDLLVDGSVMLMLAAPSFSGSLNTTLLAEGPHVLTARAIDFAGNIGAEGPPVNVRVDNQILTVTITPPAENQAFGAMVLAQASVSEPVDRVEFSVGCGAALEGCPAAIVDTTAPYAATLDLSGIADGPAAITATAIGTTGEIATDTVTIRVDRTPPAAPDGARISAEPPAGGVSQVFGQAAAVEPNVFVEITNTAGGASTTGLAAADGSFLAAIAAAVDDVVSVVAIDAVVKAARTSASGTTPSSTVASTTKCVHSSSSPRSSWRSGWTSGPQQAARSAQVARPSARLMGRGPRRRRGPARR